MANDEKYGLYIGNLSPKTTHDDLSDKFMRWGSSFSGQIVEDKITGRPRGFAFVYYQDERALEDALMHTIGTRLHGRVLNIKRAHRNTGRGDSGYDYRGKSYCYICGEGHFTGDCYGDGGSSEDGLQCYNCGEPGHFARECYSSNAIKSYSDDKELHPTYGEAATRTKAQLKETAGTVPRMDGLYRDCDDEEVDPNSAENLTLLRFAAKCLIETSAAAPHGGSRKQAEPAIIRVFSDNESNDMALQGEKTTKVKGFPVPNKYVALYKAIYEKHGHIATKTVIKNSMMALFALVTDLLAIISQMKETSFSNLSMSLLDHWESKVSTAEAVEFNVGWLRTRLNELKIELIVAKTLRSMLGNDEKVLKVTRDDVKVASKPEETLKAQLLSRIMQSK